MTLLEKLVTIRSKDPEFFGLLCELARSGPFTPVMDELEKYSSDPALCPVLPDSLRIFPKLQSRLSRRELLREEPELSKVAPRDFLTLAEFSDVRPDPERMFQSADAVFMRLLDTTKQGPVTIAKLIQDNFCKLAILKIYFPALVIKLEAIAYEDSWMADMTEVERSLIQGDPGEMSITAGMFLQAVEAAPRIPGGISATEIVLNLPRFSTMTSNEVLSYSEVHRSLPDPDALIDKTVTPNASVEKGRALAQLGFERKAYARGSGSSICCAEAAPASLGRLAD